MGETVNFLFGSNWFDGIDNAGELIDRLLAKHGIEPFTKEYDDYWDELKSRLTDVFGDATPKNAVRLFISYMLCDACNYIKNKENLPMDTLDYEISGPYYLNIYENGKEI